MVSINREPLLLIVISAWVIYRILAVRQNGGINLLREVLLNLFLVYTLVVFSYTFFPINISLFGFDLQKANLIPFDQTLRYLQRLEEPIAIRNLAGNLFLLTPLGIFLPLLFRRLQDFWRVSAIGLLATLIIETFQMFLMVRVFDIDDIILNFLGVIIGYGIFDLFMLAPIIRSGVRHTAIQGSPQSRRLFMGFAGAVFLSFVLICILALIQSTQAIGEITNRLSAGNTQLVHQERLDMFALVLVETTEGTDTLYTYREVAFGRYVVVDRIDNLALEETEYRINGSANIGSKLDTIVIARSREKVATLEMGGQNYPIVSIGDYHFAHVRLRPQPTLDPGLILRFLAENGAPLNLVRTSN